jgi:hypothetical protein
MTRHLISLLCFNTHSRNKNRPTGSYKKSFLQFQSYLLIVTPLHVYIVMHMRIWETVSSTISGSNDQTEINTPYIVISPFIRIRLIEGGNRRTHSLQTIEIAVRWGIASNIMVPLFTSQSMTMKVLPLSKGLHLTNCVAYLLFLYYTFDLLLHMSQNACFTFFSNKLHKYEMVLCYLKSLYSWRRDFQGR